MIVHPAEEEEAGACVDRRHPAHVRTKSITWRSHRGVNRMNPNKDDEPSPYKRVVLKNACPYHYMKVCLELEDSSTRLSAVDLKHFIITGLKSLFGEVGAALHFDLLKYDDDTLTALLRVCSRGLVKLWSSLTLLGSYKQQKCAFRVLQVSPFLLALTANSRELHLD
ncbi:ribonuclease P protein subunit p14 isoform X1 [Entelurus aequoreus]|uniref:ribonuclease P protein subunit p14 isoform X1 n=2 Tax=Entelurus aequoreus TaxID=161455 RepID=UPI002B1E46F6|nr:ribonuclease P protein subunit p14 isoform X1 [Entelurus aequoreus]